MDHSSSRCQPLSTPRLTAKILHTKYVILLYDFNSILKSRQHPEGRLLSPFIIKLATPSLRLKEGSISEHGYPKGLFALIMAAVRVLRGIPMKSDANHVVSSLNVQYVRSRSL
jgi:hypothetical protein